MKNYSIIALVIAMLFPIFAIGKDRTKTEMDSIVTSVLNKIDKAKLSHGTFAKENLILSVESSAIINTQVKGEIKNSTNLFAVYTFESGRPGYVIVSTDDRLPAVIAFSDKETFSTSNLPTAMLHMMEQYMNRLSEGYCIYDDNKKRQVYPETSSEIEPLLGNIAFSQGSPYNDKCPLMDGERTVTGCLATAMAQLMAYYKFPQKMSGDKIEYATVDGLPVSWDCSSTVFDWENMLDTYSEAIIDYGFDEITTNKQYMTFTGIEQSTEYKQYLEVYKFTNISTDLLNGNAQLLLTDNWGNFIRPVGKKYEINDLGSRWGYGTYYFKHFIPSDIPDGLYRLCIGFKPNGSNEWSIVQRAINEENVFQSSYEEYYITISKVGTYYMIGNNTFACGYTKSQGDAVATLCAACGAATQMNYGLEGSSTSNSNMALGLAKYMDYNEWMYFVDSNPTEGWVESIIQTELKENRPIYCCGTLENGEGSHAFVIDGYTFWNDIPYFHVNWGWNGQDNGYFLLDNMTTSGGKNYGYTYSLTMGIKPNDGIEYGFVFGAQSISASFANQELSITAENLRNYTIKTFGGDLIIYAIDKNGNEHALKKNTWDSWKEFAGYGLWNQIISIPNEIESGEYQIVIRTKEKGSSVERDILTPSFPTVYIDNEISAIDEVKTNDIYHSPAIYDLSGRKLKTTNKKQIYIIDKKKTNE